MGKTLAHIGSSRRLDLLPACVRALGGAAYLYGLGITYTHQILAEQWLKQHKVKHVELSSCTKEECIH